MVMVMVMVGCVCRILPDMCLSPLIPYSALKTLVKIWKTGSAQPLECCVVQGWDGRRHNVTSTIAFSSRVNGEPRDFIFMGHRRSKTSALNVTFVL